MYLIDFYIFSDSFQAGNSNEEENIGVIKITKCSGKNLIDN